MGKEADERKSGIKKLYWKSSVFSDGDKSWRSRIKNEYICYPSMDGRNKLKNELDLVSDANYSLQPITMM